jgi:N-acetylglucosamine-6-phosphate deacetylase
MTQFALAGCRIFDGISFVDDHAVVIDGDSIVAVVARNSVAPGTEARDLDGGLLAPGFVDVQVNGGGGALLNGSPDLGTVCRIAESHRKHGTTGLLPTVITDTPQIMAKAIAAVAEARKAGVPGVLGIHVEGPFLDLARKGAHDESCIREITPADVEQLARADCGVVMLTVAPNRVSPSQIKVLTQHGIRVSLGHSDASFEQAMEALGAGATSFTHLFNAMSQLSGREPGMVGAAFADKDSFVGLIADGHHVHPACLQIALATIGRDRVVLVSDAMPSAAGGPQEFELQCRKVRVRNGRLELADGTLAGSTTTMDAAVRYCVAEIGAPLEDALRMASTNPARFLGLGNTYGRIAAGFKASLVHLGDDLNVRCTWIDGQCDPVKPFDSRSKA